MPRGTGGVTTFSRLAHISIAVKDMQESVAYYESLGIGPFREPANHVFPVKTLRGVPLDAEVVIREAPLGPVTLQLVQHIRGDHVVKEFIDRKGGGVYHLGFLVDDVDGHENGMRDRGIGVIQRGRRRDGTGYTYFDTEDKAGVVLEIKERPKDRR